MTLALVSALDVPMASVVRVLAMDAMEPTANVTKTSVLVTKKNNAVLENKQSYPLLFIALCITCNENIITIGRMNWI